uniref:Potassium channel, subfamily K, member 17 n=1 Tax=Takifugu rubripes TaxID=31033 RepID=H2SMM2_TAKRU
HHRPQKREILNLARIPSILLLGIIYVAYVLIGGLVFWSLEGDLGRKDISLLLLNRNRLTAVQLHLGILMCSQVVLDASKLGLSLKGNHTTDGFWKFTSSAVFAATVVTTIGYGNMSPSSTAGQIFCVFFALFGIPLNVVVLNRVGKYMLVIVKNISTLLEGKTKHEVRRSFANLALRLPCLLCLFFVVPMIMFQQQEGWTYSEAIYYCFITLSTVGFGDFVAGTVLNPDKVYPEWYSILMASWIFFGLAWLSLLINHSIDILEQINSYLKRQWSGRRKEDVLTTQCKTQDAQVDKEEEPKSPSPQTGVNL